MDGNSVFEDGPWEVPSTGGIRSKAVGLGRWSKAAGTAVWPALVADNATKVGWGQVMICPKYAMLMPLTFTLWALGSHCKFQVEE